MVRAVPPIRIIADVATILAVDDEPDLRRVIERILTRCGHRVAAATGVADALRVLDSLDDDPDLLLTDVRMPDGTGADLAIEVRRRRPGTPVLYVSGLPADRVPTGASESMLEKPFNPAQLAEAVDRALTP
jgi:hypothetical protein